MKNLIFLLLITLSSFVSWQKDNAAINNGLTGKWELTEYLITPEIPVHGVRQITLQDISLNSELIGSFTSSNGIYNGATKYQQTDSVRIKFLQPQTGTETKCYFSIEDNNQTLIISPIGCIEGCSNKYKAVENDDKGK